MKSTLKSDLTIDLDSSLDKEYLIIVWEINHDKIPSTVDAFLSDSARPDTNFAETQ